MVDQGSTFIIASANGRCSQRRTCYPVVYHRGYASLIYFGAPLIHRHYPTSQPGCDLSGHLSSPMSRLVLRRPNEARILPLPTQRYRTGRPDLTCLGTSMSLRRFRLSVGGTLEDLTVTQLADYAHAMHDLEQVHGDGCHSKLIMDLEVGGWKMTARLKLALHHRGSLVCSYRCLQRASNMFRDVSTRAVATSMSNLLCTLITCNA